MCPAGTVLSSWDLTVLSVSVLDWSDSELLTFAFTLLPEDTLRLKEEKKTSISKFVEKNLVVRRKRIHNAVGLKDKKVFFLKEAS